MKHNTDNHFETIAAGVRAVKVTPAMVDAIEAKAKPEPYQVKPFYTTREDDIGRAMLVGMAIGGIIFGLLSGMVGFSAGVRRGDGYRITAEQLSTDLENARERIGQLEAKLAQEAPR